MDQSSRIIMNSYPSLQGTQMQGSQPGLQPDFQNPNINTPPNQLNNLSGVQRTQLGNAKGVKLPPIKRQPTQPFQEVKLSQEVTPTKQPRQQNPSTRGSPTRLAIDSRPLPGYEQANHEKTLQYWNSVSYCKKIHRQGQQDQFLRFGVTDEITQLKQYGVGVYLYLEFLKRLFIAFFIISALMVLPLYLNYTSEGLSQYKPSFTLTLAKFSLGNFADGDQKEYIMQLASDVLAMIVFFGFYVEWRIFSHKVVSEQEQDPNILDPSMYAISIVGFNPKTPGLETALKDYFVYLAYEVEIVYNFNRNFSKFIELQQLLQQKQKQRQLEKRARLINNDTTQIKNKIQELTQKIKQKESEILNQSKNFEPIYAIVHFSTIAAKYDFINKCRRYHMINSFGSRFRRWLCCIPSWPLKDKLKGKDDLLLESTKLPNPEIIRWDNIDVRGFNYFCRAILSVVLIVVAIFITSSLIALCTLYVTSTSNCRDFNAETTLAQAQAQQAQQILTQSKKLVKFCFCNANYLNMFDDTSIASYCSTIETDILITNVVQISASLVSTVTNILLIVIVSIIADKLLKPDNRPEQFNFIYVSVLISNLINTTIVPMMLNGDIFRFRSVTYLSFISFLDLNKISVFRDFDRDWYAVVSPYYINFFIISAVSPLIQLAVTFLKRKFVDWRVMKMCQGNEYSEYIQKQANSTIIMFPFDFPTDVAVISVQMFLCFMYSSFLPLAIPIFTFGLLLNVFVKRYIIMNYTVRIPVNESINEKIINFIPFVILIHGLFGVWARTADGIFNDEAYLTFFDFSKYINNEILLRVLDDLIFLGVTALVLVFIIFDFTIIKFFSLVKKCCQNDLETPQNLLKIRSNVYAKRLKKTNILGSYKLVNNPTFKHAYAAYLELKEAQEIARNQSSLNNSDMQLNPGFRV